MIENNKQERQIISKILIQVEIEKKSKEQLGQIMHVIGFEEDVPFAKSLFSDTLSHIYKKYQGEYQKFTATDAIAQMSSSTRQFLFKIFRLYHQHKILGKNQLTSTRSTIDHLSMPDPNNIQEIISFQKAMYQLFKHMMPNKSNPTPQPSTQIHNLKAFSPYPTYQETNFHQFENDFYPMQNSFVHSIGSRPFTSGNFEYDSGRGANNMFSFNQTDPLLDQHSLYLKRRSNQFPDLEGPSKQSINSFASSNSLREENRQSRGFTAFNDQEDTLGQPTKKVKKDKGKLCPPNFQSMKRQLQNYKRNQNKVCQPKSSGNNEDFIIPVNEGSMLIKQSISQYLPVQENRKDQQKGENGQR